MIRMCCFHLVLTNCWIWSIWQDNGLLPIGEPLILLHGDNLVRRTLQVAEKVCPEDCFNLIEKNLMFKGVVLSTKRRLLQRWWHLAMPTRRVPLAGPGILMWTYKLAMICWTPVPVMFFWRKIPPVARQQRGNLNHINDNAPSEIFA